MGSGALSKLLGAGGGGFMLFYAHQDKHARLDNAMAKLDAYPFNLNWKKKVQKLYMLKVAFYICFDYDYFCFHLIIN